MYSEPLTQQQIETCEGVIERDGTIALCARPVVVRCLLLCQECYDIALAESDAFVAEMERRDPAFAALRRALIADLARRIP